MPVFSDEHFFFSFSNAENINNIEGAAQGFSRCFGKFHNKKGVQDKKRGKKGASLGDLVKNLFKRGMPL